MVIGSKGIYIATLRSFFSSSSSGECKRRAANKKDRGIFFLVEKSGDPTREQFPLYSLYEL